MIPHSNGSDFTNYAGSTGYSLFTHYSIRRTLFHLRLQLTWSLGCCPRVWLFILCYSNNLYMKYNNIMQVVHKHKLMSNLVVFDGCCVIYATGMQKLQQQ